MKWFLVSALLLFVPSLAASAPADSTGAVPHPNSLRAGMWALQFDVNGQLLDVESFSGGVSFKRQFAPVWALRFGVGFSGSGSSTDPDAFDLPDIKSSSDAYSFTLETVYQRYFDPDAIVNAYWGVGPVGSYIRRSSEESSDSTRSESTTTEWRAGAIVSLGAEWFFKKQFSLHGEFTATGTYRSATQEREATRLGYPSFYRKSEFDGWSFGTSNAVRLGLSVYF